MDPTLADGLSASTDGPDALSTPEARSAKRIFTGLATLAIMLVIYGSWLPFAFRSDIPFETGPALLQQLDWCMPNFGDALTNLVIYVPIGLFLAMRLMLSGMPRTLQVVQVVAVAFFTSSFSETGQLFIPARHASYTDMLFNGVGTIMGLLLAAPALALTIRLHRQLKLGLALRPMRALFWIVLVLVLAAKLAPFDFAVLPKDLQHSLATARWSPFDAPAVPSGTMLEDMVELAGSFFAFVVLGIFGALALREENELPSVCVTVTTAKLGIAAVLIEIMQLVLRSHTCDMADALTYLMGALVGSALGATVIDRQRRAGTVAGQVNPAGKMLLMAALVIQITLIAGYAYPAGGRWIMPSDSSIQWIPFYAQYQKPFALALGQIISSLMWYLTLATIAAAMLPDSSWRLTFARTVLLTVGVVTLTESLQAFNESRYADITELLLALAAAALATSAYRWIRKTVVGQEIAVSSKP